jgi:hypothetical protein
VGDFQTPGNWSHHNVTFLSADVQERMPFAMSKMVVEGGLSERRVFGYFYAIALGAEVIYETEDDIGPSPGWLMQRWRLHSLPSLLMMLTWDGFDLICTIK